MPLSRSTAAEAVSASAAVLRPAPRVNLAVPSHLLAIANEDVTAIGKIHDAREGSNALGQPEFRLAEDDFQDDSLAQV